MDNKTFNYTYSAKEQEEIQKIRKKYLPTDKKEDSIQKLRRLDTSVTRKAQAFALTLGIIGALILGMGMSLIMTDLNETLGMTNTVSLIVGTSIGIIGMIPMLTAYPAYNYVVRKEREKIAPEILRLTEKLMK